MTRSRITENELDISLKNKINQSGSSNAELEAHIVKVATNSTIGHVKPDGITITVSGDGTLSGANTYTLPIASTTVLGGIKPDGVTIGVNSGTGVLSVRVNEILYQSSVTKSTSSNALGYATFANPAVDARYIISQNASTSTLTLDSTTGYAIGNDVIVYNVTGVKNKFKVTAVTSTTITLDGNTGIGSSSLVVYKDTFSVASDQFATGTGSFASGQTSNANGYRTMAFGDYSNSQGNTTVASGLNSSSFGNLTTSNTFASVSTGRANKLMTGTATSYSATGDALVVGNGTSATARSNAFRVTFDGKTYGLSAFNSTGADYAEYFEWVDGNVDNEDRVGTVVTLDGEGIRKATAEDTYILGIISANPSVVGDSYQDDWNNKYLTDEFGRIQYEYVDVEYEEIIDIIDDEPLYEVVIKKEYLPVINPLWNNEQEYISREQRSEWDAVGMMGKLLVRDDGTCKVNSYAKVGLVDGEFTHSEEITRFRVMNRVSDNIVKVLLK